MANKKVEGKNGMNGYIIRRRCDHCGHRTEHWQAYLSSVLAQCLACGRWRTPMSTDMDLVAPRLPVGSKRYRLKLATWTVVRESGQPSPRRLSTAAEVAALAADLLREHDDEKEHFFVLTLGSQNDLLLVHHVSMGSLSASIVHPREVLGTAIREGAAHLILIHNHPSGDPTPSKEDISLTRQLHEGARLLGIKVHDHLIIGNGTLKWVSLAQREE